MMESSTDEEIHGEQSLEREIKHRSKLTHNMAVKHERRKRKEIHDSYSDHEEYLLNESQTNVNMAKKNKSGGKVKLKRQIESGVESDSDSSLNDENTNSNSDCDENSDHGEGLKSSVKGDNEVPEESERLLDEEQEESELKAVKSELSHMSFEELLQLKEKLGMKVFNEVMHGTATQSKKKKKPTEKTVYKRENRKRPLERTSKKTVSRFRHIIPTKKNVVRDPRFDERSGEFAEEYFKKSYSFLDDVKNREREKLKKQLQKAKNPETKSKVKSLLNRMNQQDLAAENKAKKAETEKEWAKREKELVAQGKKQFYLKKSDKRKLELAEKYKELKKSGKLEKYMSKKRKKNTQKERRKMIN